MTATRTIDMSHPRTAIEGSEHQRMNIKAIAIVAQPTSWANLEAWLENLSGSERAVATTAAMMAWNLAAHFDGHNQATEATRAGVDQ